MATEIAYLSHKNTIDLILKADGVAQDLTTVTQITLTLGTKLITSTNQAVDPILWNKAGYATGEVRLVLGSQTITPGTYDTAYLVVYDPTNALGIVWGSIKMEVLADVEAT